jgi:exodeoxyribonuclease V beta subunit
MPVGVDIGTFVHRVLQNIDFAAADLDSALDEQIETVMGRRQLQLGDRSAVIGGLRAAIETPLGPLFDGASLRDLRNADRLDELEFELPLVGGDEPTGQLTLDAIAGVVREHASPNSPLSGYAEHLTDPALRQSVRGYLTGTIDVVARLPGQATEERFAVLDYKTNWLGPPETTLSVWHYRPSALVAEMQRAHYLLQALLYTVGLHRYLRWRLNAYEPDRNLAGVGYLFLRGLIGPDTPTADGQPCGVFGWRPPKALVEAISNVLDRGAPV